MIIRIYIDLFNVKSIRNGHVVFVILFPPTYNSTDVFRIRPYAVAIVRWPMYRVDLCRVLDAIN